MRMSVIAGDILFHNAFPCVFFARSRKLLIPAIVISASVADAVFSTEPKLVETGGKCVIIPLTKLKKAEVIRLEGEKPHVFVCYYTRGKRCWRLKEDEFSLEFTGGDVSLILKEIRSKIVKVKVFTRRYVIWKYVVKKPELDPPTSGGTDHGGHGYLGKCRAIA